MVKYLRCKTGNELENSINSWIDKNKNISIINIIYTISSEETDTWHNVLICYE